MLRKINLRRDRWAYPPQRSLLRSAEVGHPGWVFSISCQQYWFENSIWSVRLITLRFVIRLFVTPSTTREQELPYSYDGGEAAVNGGLHAWRWGRGVVFGNSGVRGPAIRLARDIALTLVTRMKSLRTLLVELKQLRAEIGYILGWIGTVLAALILIASAILYLAWAMSPRSHLAGFALAVFVTGWAACYILTARA